MFPPAGAMAAPTEPPESAEVEDSAESEEQRRVRQWRFTQFRRLGFQTYAAAWLAQGRADVHQVEEMLEQGCSTETALRIFL